LFHEDGLTDRHYEANSRFSQFFEGAEKRKWQIHESVILRTQGKGCNYTDSGIRKHKAYKTYRSKDSKLRAFSISELVR
jgi:hypothetical protein